MPFKIAIASGKGGTGKTTVAVNLFCFFKNQSGGKVLLVDCDVEEPNDVIFFSGAIRKDEILINQLIPRINNDKCTFCRKCVEYCEFNALVIIPPARFAEVNASLCHSCGGCLIACGENAITERPYPVGTVTFYDLENGCRLVEGKLKIGSARQTMLIKELKKKITNDSDIVFFDAPPGTSCPVVETISDADYVILVTEPTLFGLNDLELMTGFLSKIQKPFGVVINKAGLGNNLAHEFIENTGVELLTEIPFSKEYASCYATGRLLNGIPEEIFDAYLRIANKLEEKILKYEGNNCFKW